MVKYHFIMPKKPLSIFDVLIVYSQTSTISASNNLASNPCPFPLNSKNASYNTVYAYFLEMCQRANVKAAFTTSADIIGPGTCKSFWTYQGKSWQKHNHPCYSKLIFDKFSPVTFEISSRRKLLFSSAKIKPFNDPDLFNLFFDKQLTFNNLSDYSIPTLSLLSADLPSISSALDSLSTLLTQHSGFNDFSNDIIMKDRFGSGGRHVYKFKANQPQKMLSVIKRNNHHTFIIQPFAKFDQGYCYRQFKAATDIRLIYLKGKIVQSYIRIAKNGEFRCNEHQGGLLTYVTLKDIPKPILAKSKLIAKHLNKNDSLYALDFIISNNGNPYLLEGNTGPGLDWNMSLIKNEKQAKKLIRMVVSQLSVRTQIQ